MPGANSFAAGLLSDETVSIETLVEDIENDSIKGLILVESNPRWKFPDGQRLEKALARLELMVVMDYLNSETAQKAHIFLPTTTLYEGGGIYMNQEARVQVAQPAYRGGTSIGLTGGGDYPPRIYGTGIPGNEPAAAWKLLAYLIDDGQQSTTKDLRDGIWNWLAETQSGFEDLGAIEEIHDDGARFYRAPDFSGRFSSDPPSGDSISDDHLELSDCLAELAGTPAVLMGSGDAAELNLADGDVVSIELDRGTIEANLKVADHMAAGTLIIPRHKDLSWQKMGTGQTWVRKDRVRKV